MNKYKKGQILVNHDGGKRKVLFVGGDIVFVSKIDEYNVSAKNNYHYKEVDKACTLEPTKGWEPLTADNWKERRDMGVWCRDEYGAMRGPYKLIGFEPKANYPVKAINEHGEMVIYKEASIYSHDGIEAIWEGDK